jgi:prepilin-type N-terminal cleavage/methylation domain-containing protein
VLVTANESPIRAFYRSLLRVNPSVDLNTITVDEYVTAKENRMQRFVWTLEDAVAAKRENRISTELSDTLESFKETEHLEMFGGNYVIDGEPSRVVIVRSEDMKQEFLTKRQSWETEGETVTNNKREHAHSKGFSLVELLITVAIILIISAIAVPQMIASIQRGNEVSAASNLRQVITAENHYYQQYAGFAAAAADLGDEGGSVACGTGVPGAAGKGACVLQSSLADNIGTNAISGYAYTYAVTGSIAGNQGATTLGTSWVATATPQSSYKGAKAYCADSSGAIIYSPGVTAITPASGGLCPATTSSGPYPVGS